MRSTEPWPWADIHWFGVDVGEWIQVGDVALFCRVQCQVMATPEARYITHGLRGTGRESPQGTEGGLVQYGNPQHPSDQVLCFSGVHTE